MDARHNTGADSRAERTTRLISHLEGALEARTLDAMRGVWTTLERATTDPAAHARAVRERLFWQTLTPGDSTAGTALGSRVVGLTTVWDEETDVAAHAEAAAGTVTVEDVSFDEAA